MHFGDIMNNNKDIFETMPVPRALAALAVPTIISQLITMIYNVADTFFIGRTNDPYKIAAVSLVYALSFLMNALANLFGIGGGSLISRLLGINDTEHAKKVCAFSFYGAIVAAFVYSISCFTFMEPLLCLLGASDNTISYSSQYVFWVVVVGGIVSILSMTMSHLLRSEGYAKQASFGLGMGGILNIILDPVFMFVILPSGMEVTGAALATLFSNICTLIYFLIMFCRLRSTTVLCISVKDVRLEGKYVKAVFAVGFPSAVGSLFACLTNTTISHLASGYGDIAVAAVGIVKKIDMLPLNIGMGLCQGMMPLAAYNYSAKNYKRMKETANCARIAGICFAAVCVLVFEIFAPDIIALFIQETQTVELGTGFLRVACLAVPFTVINFQMSYMFQAVGKGAQSLFLNSCKQGFLNIPFLFLMNMIFGLYGIIWTQLLADSITLILSFVLYRKFNGELSCAGR